MARDYQAETIATLKAEIDELLLERAALRRRAYRPGTPLARNVVENAIPKNPRRHCGYCGAGTCTCGLEGYPE
jgi:hypothetical protein